MSKIPAIVLNLGFLVVFTAQVSALTPNQIAEMARVKVKENLKKYRATPCHWVEIKEELNEKGIVEEREEKTCRLAASSAPVPGGKEIERISPEIQNRTQGDDSSVLDDLKMFDWRLENEDDSQGEPCYRLAFSPKKSGMTLNPRQAVLFQSRGRCWVAKSDFSKIRLEGHLVKPLELMGSLVTVHEVDFLTTTRRIAEGVAAPLQIRYRYLVEVFPFFEFHERHTQNFDFTGQARSWASPRNQNGGMAGLK